MTVGNIVAIIGAAVGIGGLIVTLYKTRGDNASKAGTIKQQLDARIDARVELQLKEAWKRIDTLETDRDAQTLAVGILGEGFDALEGIVERLEPQPVRSAWEQEVIERAKTLRGDGRWSTNSRINPA